MVPHTPGFHYSAGCWVCFSPKNEGRIASLCPSSAKIGMDIVFTGRYPQVTMEQVDQLLKLYAAKENYLTDGGTEGEE